MQVVSLKAKRLDLGFEIANAKGQQDLPVFKHQAMKPGQKSPALRRQFVCQSVLLSAGVCWPRPQFAQVNGTLDDGHIVQGLRSPPLGLPARPVTQKVCPVAKASVKNLHEWGTEPAGLMIRR